MAKKLSKVLCIIMAALMVLTVMLPAVSAAENKNIPIVFVGGRGTKLLDKDGKQIYPVTYDRKDYITEQAKVILPILGKAMVTDNYDEYCDALFNAVSPLYDDMRLNSDGNVENGSHTFFTWSKRNLKSRLRKPGDPYKIYDFCFYYDWRIDMWEVADQLAAYIEDLCEVSGFEKINIIGRCMGGNIVSAYLTKYGNKRVNKVIFYATTANGAIESGAPFSGQLEVEGSSLARYASDLLGDELLDELIRSTLNLYDATSGMRLPVNFINNLYEKICDNVVPRLIMTSYGSYPSYWEMVDPEHYEAAKAFAFAGKEAEYHEFIKKIDNYHYNVMLPLYSTLKKLEAQGLKVYLVTKYGKQIVPIMKDSDILSDDTVELSKQSFGATCSTINGTLTGEYIKGRTDAGFGKYISPDKQIDASTGLFPDRTWYIKHCHHMDFNNAINDLMVYIMHYDGHMTVNDAEQYPQFMAENEKEKKIYPMTEDNINPPIKYNPGFFEALRNFFAAIIRYIINFFENGFTC